MENIKIYDFTKSDIAIDINEAKLISKTIIQRYNSSHSKIIIDFSNITISISPFMRTLLRPLITNSVDFEWINFWNTKTKDTYQRILEQFEIIGTENIIELNN